MMIAPESGLEIKGRMIVFPMEESDCWLIRLLVSHCVLLQALLVKFHFAWHKTRWRQQWLGILKTLLGKLTRSALE